MVNVQQFSPKITPLSLIHTHFLFNLSIKLLIRLGLVLHCSTNTVGMASCLSLTLFISYPTDRAKGGEITNIHSSKCFPQSLLQQVGFHCTLFVFRSQSHKRVLFWGMNAYSIHWQIHLHNYKHRNTSFYMFNKDNIEYVIQVKQGHSECLASVFIKEVYFQEKKFKYK